MDPRQGAGKRRSKKKYGNHQRSRVESFGERLERAGSPKPRGFQKEARKRRALRGHHGSFPSFAKTPEQRENAALVANLRVPEDTITEDWFAEHIVTFFNDISQIYIAVENEVKGIYNSPGTGYVVGRAPFRWREDKAQKAEVLPSPIYVDRTLELLRTLIEDQDVFPEQDDDNGIYDPSFAAELCPMIFRRLFHVYVIVVGSYEDLVRSYGELENLKQSFKHFMFFVFEHGLLPNFYYIDVFNPDDPKFKTTHTIVDDLIEDLQVQYDETKQAFERNTFEQ